ncbi:MAG: ubiquinol-cytochrome c reductase cytochrome c subunit [Frankiales bacterium]|nr:ubiquinol-cytochrome c reductase cytochrome c subunit [Frankiales bacterium]
MTSVTSSPAPARRSARSRLAGVLTLAIALTMLGGLYAALAPSTRAAGLPYTPQQIAAGKDLFLRGCSSCHGLNAQGTRQAPSLIGVGPAAVDFQVSTGRMPLASFYAQADRKPTRYSEPQIAELAAYVYSVSGNTGPLVPTVTAQDLAKSDLAHGGELFRYNCAQCHGASGGGGAISGGGYAPDLAQATATQIYEAMLTGPEQMPKFSQLPAQTKVDIIRFVQDVTRQGVNAGGQPIGKLGPVPEGLAAWTIGIGACIALTLWIGARR